MLQVNPEQRPSAGELLNDQWVNAWLIRIFQFIIIMACNKQSLGGFVVDGQSAIGGESNRSFILFGEFFEEIGQVLEGLLDGLWELCEVVFDRHEGFEILL
jgi:hypothetical protein